MKISYKTIEQIVEDVVPKVESLTGWNAHPDSLNISIIRRRDYWNSVMERRLKEGAGLSEEECKIRRKKLNLLPYLSFAEYSLEDDRIIIVQDNISERTNKDGLSLYVSHEIAHRCQFLNNPEFRDEINEISKRYYPIIFGRENVEAIKDNKDIDEWNSVLEFLEADVNIIESIMKDRYYSNSIERPAFLPGAVSLYLGIINSGNRENMRESIQNTNMYENLIIHTLIKKGREGVNELYSLPIENITKIVGQD
ncbi:MAG: hypothetical protein ACLFPQ_04560 [Candidatus Woesearchaeota archaeon]